VLDPEVRSEVRVDAGFGVRIERPVKGEPLQRALTLVTRRWISVRAST